MARVLGSKSGLLGGWWRRYCGCVFGAFSRAEGRCMCVLVGLKILYIWMGVYCRYRLIDMVIE